MKKDEFIKKVLTEAGVSAEKLATVTEDEIGEEFIGAYTSNLLTRERAIMDDGVNKKMHAKFYALISDGFDKDFTAYAEANLAKEITEQIKAEPVTRNKWDLLKRNLPTGAVTDEKLKVVRAEIATLHEALKAKDIEFTTFKTQADQKVTNFQKDFMLGQELSKLDISDTAKQFLTPKQIQDQFVEKLAPKGILIALENNALVPRVKNAEGTMLDLYEGNQKLTLQDLMKRELANILKQSAGTGTPTGGAAPIVIPQGAMPEGLSLMQMNALRVAEKFKKMRDEAVTK